MGSTRKQTRTVDLTQIRDLLSGRRNGVKNIPVALRQRGLIDEIARNKEDTRECISDFVPTTIDPKKSVGIMRGEVERITGTAIRATMFDAEVNMAPFFAALTQDVEQRYTVQIINGSVVREQNTLNAAVRGDAIVGNRENGCGNGSTFCMAPANESNGCLADVGWQVLDTATKRAIEKYTDVSGRRVGRRIKMPRFSREQPNISTTYEQGCDVELLKLKAFLKALSEVAASGRIAVYSTVEVVLARHTRIYVNSEGTELVDSDLRMQITLKAEGFSNNGLDEIRRDYYLRDLSKIDFEKLRTDMIILLQELEELKRAPTQQAGEYPVVISPNIHSVLWHEAIGHGLEKRPDASESEVLTFRGKLGSLVCPKTISLIADPTIPGGWGSYEFDDEGVRGKRVTLVDKGKLVGYLHSRGTAGEGNTHSNGHARGDAASAEYVGGDIGSEGIPCPRMSNLVVQPEVTEPVTELFRKLIERVRRENKEYGIYLGSGRSGLVTESGHFEIEPTGIFRIYQDGHVERVRGVKVIGTPFTVLSQIKAFGDDATRIPGYCGAESGYIPVSETTPSALVLRLELAPIEEDKERKPLLPRPKREKIS